MEEPNGTDDLKRSAPTLFGLPKADPFVVPAGFFERFPHEVQAMAVAQRTTPSLWIWLRRAAIALPAAALILGLAWRMQRGTTDVPALASVEVTPLTNEELDQLDDNELLAIVESSSPASATADLGQVAVQLNDDELLAYLENENTDLTELITPE